MKLEKKIENELQESCIGFQANGNDGDGYVYRAGLLVRIKRIIKDHKAEKKAEKRNQIISDEAMRAH